MSQAMTVGGRPPHSVGRADWGGAARLVAVVGYNQPRTGRAAAADSRTAGVGRGDGTGWEPRPRHTGPARRPSQPLLPLPRLGHLTERNGKRHGKTETRSDDRHDTVEHSRTWNRESIHRRDAEECELIDAPNGSQKDASETHGCDLIGFNAAHG